MIANDPDVDRLAVAVRAADGTFVQLTGNQLGALLGHYVLAKDKAPVTKRVVLASVVSSPALRAIAQGMGVAYEETLTGCKWIAHRALELEAQGTSFVFGFEEALGYCIGSVVRDKDGTSAALLAAELAAECRARGETLLDELAALSRRFGLFVSAQARSGFPAPTAAPGSQTP